MKIVNINGRLETQGTGEETDAQAKTAVKPPAVWRTADQIPQSERHGLWFYSDDDNPVCEERLAMERKFNSEEGLYLKAPDGVASHSAYHHDLYQQPDADGWFAHDPQPDSVCPVPEGVRCELRYVDGTGIGEEGWTLGSAWLGWDSYIAAWRPVWVAA